jgi:hypothetical protein
MGILRAGAVYFALVFGAGFVLGTVRVLWVVGRVGTRTAELLEAPLMLAVTVLAARWVARRLGNRRTPSRLLAVGGLALALLLSCELTVVLWLQGMTIRQSVASRDPVGGAVYLAMLGVFAVMPALLGRK